MHPGAFSQMVMAHHTEYLHDATRHHHSNGRQGDRRRAPRWSWLGGLRMWLAHERQATV
jgi:hypothetical protein